MKRFIVASTIVQLLCLAPTLYAVDSLPAPIIDLGFNESAGTVTANNGSAGGELTLTTPVPTWSSNVPTGIGGASSVDFGTTLGTYCVESPANYGELTGLTAFTVTGWANCRNSSEGSGGNRLVTWINHGGDGVDVVYKSDGSVQVGINQWPDGSPAQSSAGKIPTSAGAVPDNWRFFAVTYDSSLSSGQVKFYFGSSTDVAAFDVAVDYARGAVGTNISRLAIGHFNMATRNAARQDRMFRGLIDEVKVFGEALGLEQIQQVQMGNPEIAASPYPSDLAQDVPRDVVLSWEPGAFARTHDVYFGTSFETVDTASRSNPLDVLVGRDQSATTYAFDAPLVFGQTYYWRVDEVNAPPDSGIYKGAIWSFEVEPQGYPIVGVTATASSSNLSKGMTPDKTVDGSGLNENDEHGTESASMWLSAPGMPGPAWIQYEFDNVYKLYELWVWNANQDVESTIGFGAKDVTIEYSLDGVEWSTLGDVEFPQAAGEEGYRHEPPVSLDGIEAKFVRLTIHSNWKDLVQQYGLSEVRFFYLPVRARGPEPASGAMDVAVDSVLSWRAGREAVTHEVYLSTDEQAVIDGTAPVEVVTVNDFTPELMDYGQTYYWKVNEVNEAAMTSLWEGNLWNFSTAEYLVVEDFEGYTDDLDAGEAIFQTWIDGVENGTGSYVGYEMSSGGTFGERQIVHGGSQSMPLFYDNTAVATSEAQYSFGSQDWTASGLKSLSLYFYGDPDNTGQLYVKVNDIEVPYDGDPADIARAQWQPWNIDLSAVTADASNVTRLTIGIKDAGATGVLYVDDIRLYPRTPEVITPVDPGHDGLLAEYLFDNGATDTSGNGYNGTLLGDAHTLDSVLVLDGTDDAVAIPQLGGADATFHQCTYSMWMYSIRDPATSGIIGGINFDNWSAGGIHCKFYNGRANAGINGLAGGDMNGTAIVEAGEWNHLALTVTDSVATIYLNGQAEASRGFAAPLTMILGRASIGAWNNNGDIQRELTGEMDDVRIYDRAVSEAELLWLAGKRAPVHKPF